MQGEAADSEVFPERGRARPNRTAVVQRYDGLIHGFLDMTFSPAADAAVAESCDRFAEILHR